MPTSFYYGNPDLYAQQLQIERQQRLADALQQQGQQSAAPDSWNSMPVVPRVGVGGLAAKIAQQLGGAAMQRGVNQRQAGLYGQQQQYATELMKDPNNNPNGIAPATAARMAIQNPDQWNALNQRVQTPTDQILNSQQAGGTYAERLAAEQARLHAAASQALPTGPHVDPTNPTGAPAFTAQPPQNTNPNMAPSGAVTGVAPIPGATQAVSANNYAAGVGATAGGPQSYADSSGQHTTFPNPAAPNPFQMSSMAQPTMTPNPAPQSPGAPAQPQPARISHVAPNATQAGMYADATQRFASDRAAQTGVAQTQTGLENALRLAESGKFNTGPGSEAKYNYMALAQQAGIPILKDDTDGYQSIQKYLANSLASAAGGSPLSGSNEKFETLMTGNPGAGHMNNAPLADSIRYVLSQQDAYKNRFAYVSKRVGDGSNPAALNNAYTSWANEYGNGGARYFEAARQPVMTSAQPPTKGQLYHTPRGVMAGTGTGFVPVNPPQ